MNSVSTITNKIVAFKSEQKQQTEPKKVSPQVSLMSNENTAKRIGNSAALGAIFGIMSTIVPAVVMKTNKISYKSKAIKAVVMISQIIGASFSTIGLVEAGRVLGDRIGKKRYGRSFIEQNDKL